MKLPPHPDISITIGNKAIPLQARSAAIVTLLARHQAILNSSPTIKVIFDCGPSDGTLSVQPKLGKVKVRK